jgi:hypothetical protein
MLATCQCREEKKKRTSVDQKNLDSKIRIADADEDDILHLVELEVVVPEVAHELLHLRLDRALVGPRGERLGILEERVNHTLSFNEPVPRYGHTSGCVM